MPRYVPVLAILACGVLLAATRAAEPFDLRILDLQFNILRAWSARPAIRDVVVVGIDEATIKALPEPVTLWHRHLGRFLSALAAVKPAAVGIDIILPDRSFDAVVPGADKLLMRGLLEARRAYPLVLAQTIDPTGKPRAIYPPFLTIAGPGSSGYALFPVDRDGRVRRFDERLGEKGEAVLTLSGQMARRMGIEPGDGLIDFALGPRFGYVPFQQVLEWIDRNDSAQLTRAFGGKPVILGTVLPFDDRKVLPVALARWEEGMRESPGVLLHAQALRSMLGPGLIKPVDAWMVAVLAAAAALLWFVTGHAAILIAVYAALVAAVFLGSTWLLAHGWFLPVSAISLSGLVAMPYAYHVELGAKAGTINAMAERLGVDHIVIGTARKNSLTRLIQDSVISKLLKITKVPVEVIVGSEVSRIERFGLPAGLGAALAVLLAAVATAD